MANDYKGASSIYVLKFYEDLATLGAAQTITPEGGTTDMDLCSPFDGSIVGLAAEHHVTSTQTVVITAYVNSVASATITLAITGDSDNQASFMPGTWPVLIDEDIQVKASWGSGSSADDAGETSVWVFVQVGSSNT